MSLITRRNMTQKCPGSRVKTLQTGRDTKWAMTEVSGYIALRKVGSKVQPRLRKLCVTEAWPCRSISANQKAVFESDIGPGCRHSAKGGDIKKAQATSDSVSLWSDSGTRRRRACDNPWTSSISGLTSRERFCLHRNRLNRSIDGF
jgi:hypothetical protein